MKLDEILSAMNIKLSPTSCVKLVLVIVFTIIGYVALKSITEGIPPVLIITLLLALFIGFFTIVLDFLVFVSHTIWIWLIRCYTYLISKSLNLKKIIDKRKQKHVIQNSVVASIAPNEAKFLSIFFGEPIDSIKNKFELVPNEAFAYFDALCIKGLMIKENTEDSCGYVFMLDKSFANTLRKTMFNGSLYTLRLQLQKTEIQAGIHTTGGGLANGDTRIT